MSRRILESGTTEAYSNIRLVSVRCSDSKQSGIEDEKVTASLRTAKICDLHADQKVGRYRYHVQCREISAAPRVNEFDIRCSTVNYVDESAEHGKALASNTYRLFSYVTRRRRSCHERKMNAKHITCKFMLAKEDRHGKVRSVYVTIDSTAEQSLKKSLQSTKEENEC